MKDLPADAFDKLPKDGAAEHDHYIYVTPKKTPEAGFAERREDNRRSHGQSTL